MTIEVDFGRIAVYGVLNMVETQLWILWLTITITYKTKNIILYSTNYTIPYEFSEKLPMLCGAHRL